VTGIPTSDESVKTNNMRVPAPIDSDNPVALAVIIVPKATLPLNDVKITVAPDNGTNASVVEV